MKTTPPEVVTARHEAGSNVRAAGPREAWGAPARWGQRKGWICPNLILVTVVILVTLGTGINQQKA